MTKQTRRVRGPRGANHESTSSQRGQYEHVTVPPYNPVPPGPSSPGFFGMATRAWAFLLALLWDGGHDACPPRGTALVRCAHLGDRATGLGRAVLCWVGCDVTCWDGRRHVHICVCDLEKRWGEPNEFSGGSGCTGAGGRCTRSARSVKGKVPCVGSSSGVQVSSAIDLGVEIVFPH